MAFETLLLWFLGVIIVANAGLLLSKFIKLPFVLIQLILGLIISLSLKHIGELNSFEMPIKLLFFGLLPPILFESAVKIPYRKIKKDWVFILLLSTIGVAFTSAIFGGLVTLLTGLPFWLTFLIASLLSSTDPIAVLSIFKQLGISKRLIHIVDSESMLNDATSIILSKFTLLIIAASFGISEFNITNSILEFIFVVNGSIVLGVGSGFIFSNLIRSVRNNPWIELSFSILAAYIPFVIAENYLGFSGIISTVLSGIVVGNLGIYSFSSLGNNMFKQNWDYLAFLANSTVFIFLGLTLGLSLDLNTIYYAVIGYLSLIIARFISTYSIIMVNNFLSKSNYSHIVPYSWLPVLNLGALRGALPIIAGLFIAHLHPQADVIIEDYYDLFLGIIMGVVIFSLFLQGFSIQGLIKKFGLNKKDFVEKASHKWQEILAANEAYQSALKIEKKSHHKIHKNWSDLYLKELKSHIKEFLCQSKDKNQIISIIYIHTFLKEKEVYTDMYNKDMISYKVLKQLKKKIDASLDMIEEGILPNTFQGLPIMTAISKGRKKFCIKENYVYRKAREYGNIEVMDNLNKLNELKTLKPYLKAVIDLYKYFQKKNQELCKELENMHSQDTCNYEEYLGKQEYINHKKKYLSLASF